MMHQGTRRKGRTRSTSSSSTSSSNSVIGRAISRTLPRLGVRPLLERLEDRRLLATDLIISEFLADNATAAGQSTYRDPNFPNDTPDWIELYNPTNAANPLSGSKLQDSNNTWTFQTGTVPALGYFVLFADSKNINSGPYLHTNFGLSANGEYLGLLRPDNTIAHEYVPGFPRQDSNVSYGIINQSLNVPLVTSASTMKGLVPTGPLPADWNSATFNDSSWLSGPRGIGYETETVGPPAPAGWSVRMIDTSVGNLDTIAKETAMLNGNTASYKCA